MHEAATAAPSGATQSLGRATLCALGVVAVLSAGYYATWSLLLHRSFHSNGWDLGLIDQVIWNTAHGRWFEYSFRDISYAGDHWQPVLLLMVPLKWVTSGPEPLLIAQAALLGAATVPLYLAARRITGNRAVAWAPVGAYALGLGVARAVAFDFHAEAIDPLLLFGGLWALSTNRTRWFAASALAVLLVKEDGGLLTLSMCWVAACAFGRRREAGMVAAIAVLYMAVVNLWLVPHYRGGDLNPFAERFGYLGETAPEVALSLVTRPDLVVEQLATRGTAAAVVWLLAGVAALPLLRPRLLPALVLVALPPLLSQDESQPFLELHYMLVPGIVAIVLATLAIGERAMPSRARQRRAAALVTAATIALFLWRAPLPPSVAAEWDRFDIDDHAAASASIVAMIPRGEVVSAQSAFVPHLSERGKIYQFPRVIDARYVITDRYGPIPSDDIAAGYWACLADLPGLGFDVVRAVDGISLWERRADAPPPLLTGGNCSGTDATPAAPRYAAGEQPGQ